ncbi:MAG TPA: DUF4350 domain-containing protein [Thermoanaerobaculia bacterium]|nr:DUF4350 domain-containing protein [Thermoanaerobaculia bacterium]
MKELLRNRLFLGLALLLLVCVALVLLLGAPGEARGSALARGPNGWLVARRYLAARGVRVSLLGAPLERFEGDGVLVSTFPWQNRTSAESAGALENHLRRGGDLILAYSGQWGNPGELITLTGLGLPLEEVRKVTLNPVEWRRFAREAWSLHPAADAPGALPVHVWAPRWRPELPKEAQVLFRSPRGGPAIVVLRRYHGRIFLLPADAFANARLANAGNAGLLETLRRQLGDHWTFDEYHHGLIAGQQVETAALGRTLDLILLHLAVLYLIALWTLSRRFGPAWSEPPAVTGSTGSFLLGLGALHHRLGHHAAAALRLLERVRELDPGADLPADLDRRAATASPRELVELAREVAGRRTGKDKDMERDIERNTAA